jgi:hypothetical protein
LFDVDKSHLCILEKKGGGGLCRRPYEYVAKKIIAT